MELVGLNGNLEDDFERAMGQIDRVRYEELEKSMEMDPMFAELADQTKSPLKKRKNKPLSKMNQDLVEKQLFSLHLGSLSFSTDFVKSTIMENMRKLAKKENSTLDLSKYIPYKVAKINLDVDFVRHCILSCLPENSLMNKVFFDSVTKSSKFNKEVLCPDDIVNFIIFSVLSNEDFYFIDHIVCHGELNVVEKCNCILYFLIERGVFWKELFENDISKKSFNINDLINKWKTSFRKISSKNIEKRIYWQESL